MSADHTVRIVCTVVSLLEQANTPRLEIASVLLAAAIGEFKALGFTPDQLDDRFAEVLASDKASST